MTNKEKLEALKVFLNENNVKFVENHFSKTNKLTFDLLIKDLRIAVHLSDGNDQTFYKRIFKYYKPFFIRESESVDFVIEKMQNCIYDRMMLMQRKMEKANKQK
jgi:hypothetical protein